MYFVFFNFSLMEALSRSPNRKDLPGTTNGWEVAGTTMGLCWNGTTLPSSYPKAVTIAIKVNTLGMLFMAITKGLSLTFWYSPLLKTVSRCIVREFHERPWTYFRLAKNASFFFVYASWYSILDIYGLLLSVMTVWTPSWRRSVNSFLEALLRGSTCRTAGARLYVIK